MGRPSIIPSVMKRLEEYLEARELEYQALPAEKKKPTLPITGDCKINVRAIAEDIGLRKTQEKYLFERDELKSLVNLMAEGQGVLPIGARTQEDTDKSIRTKIMQTAAQARENATAAVEAQAMNNDLMQELVEAHAEIEKLCAENSRLRVQLEMIHAGIFVMVEE